MNGLDGMLEMISLPGRSFVAAILISFLIVIRALLLHRLPKLTFQAAWAVVILRLLLPVSVPVFPAAGGNGVSLLSAFLTEEPDIGDGEDGREQAVGSKDIKAAAGAPGQVRDGGYGRYGSTSEKEEQPAGNFAAARNVKTAGAALHPVLRGIWFAGMLSVLMYFLCSHFRARRIYAMALPAEHALPDVDFHGKWKALRRRVRIRVSDRISAPVTCGIVSPVILLPKTTDWDNLEQLRMVLEHEAVHIRRFDIVYKWLLAAAAALHWFNPLVWAMYYLADRDIELSCDEAVIRKLGSSKRQDYALALLNFEEKRMLSPTASGFGGSAVRERIEAIMKINKKSTVAMALAVLLIAGTTTVFAGAGENKNGLEDPNKRSGQNISENKNNSGDINVPAVKQYICEPAWYTPEEFEEAMEQERREIRAQVENGFFGQETADAMLAEIESMLREVQNGRQVEKPSPVYYADGTPVVNSKGEQLYARASDIEQMNAKLRAKAEESTEVLAGTQEDALLLTGGTAQFMTGFAMEDMPGNFEVTQTELSWYSYEEYRDYIEKQKEAYRSMLGEWGFNSMDGWYEWDAGKIEEACRLLDENLEFIKNGGMISKPDKDGAVLMQSFSGMSVSCAEGEQVVTGGAGKAENGGKLLQEATACNEGGEFDSEFLKAYEVYGVTADIEAEAYFYQGRKIAGIRDEGLLMVCGVAKEENGIYIKGVRKNGELVGIEEITREEFCELTGLSLG